jgi:DNA-directed DNA polymerase III PolC
MGFVHLHAHSNYSLLQGAMAPEELVRAAASMHMPAVALTDTNGLYGAILFYEAARRAGVKPIIGAEVVWGAEQCVLLAADRQGYANLCRIVTERKLAGTRHEKEFRVQSSECRVDGGGRPGFDIAGSVAADPEGLFVLTASPSLLRRLAGAVPPGRLYAELRADEPRSFETHCSSLRGTDGDGSAGRSEDVADVAERLGVPLVATVNVNFLKPSDRNTHAVLSAIRENVRLKDLKPGGLAGPHSYLMPAEQVAARLPACAREEAMRNALRVAEACELELDLDVPRFPRADQLGIEDPRRRLREVARAGARRRYGRLRREVRERLERELAVIEKLDFCDYFLLVRDIVAFAEREGIPHVGRGSAANSIVSYALGISAVDPLKFDLYFERFLNEFRTDVPDIDIDFCWRRRDEVIDYVYRRFGADRVAMVSTHSRLLARSAFRDVARVMGLPQDEIDALSRRLPHYGASSIGEAMEAFPEMADFPIAKEPWRTVVETALKVDGYVRHLSVHLGGLVIGDRPLTWYTALEDSAKGIVVTQYEMGSIKRTGLVKMDLLGQRSLSIVAEAARSVERLHGVRVDLDRLPDGDRRTAALLKNGRTMGCFQIESPGMRQLLQMLRAGSIMDLIQGLSLIRPGPSSSGMKGAFIRRMRGEEPVEYPTPLLKEALEKTYGVMLYQEDILRAAQAVAGFSLAEGDELRKYISKERSKEKLLRMRERFIEGAAARGVEPAAAEDIWRQVESFAAYSYCKAHACTYGHISYQAAYLKAHWPAEFLASVIANKAGFYDPRTYIEDARRFNVKILAPCVNAGDVESRPERSRGAGAIRPGLEFVRSLSTGAIKRILQQRALRPFASLEDFACRVRLGREELENLVLCGAFDSLGLTRPTLMMKLDRILSRSRRQAQPPATGIFEGAPPPADPIPVPDQPPYSLRERVLHELRILGFSHSGHPLDAWDGELTEGGTTPSFALKRCVGRRVSVAGWLVTTRRAVTRNHEYMKFLTLEDRHGVVEVVAFPDVYRRCGAAMDGAGCFRVRGTVKEQFGSVSLVADDVRSLPLPGRAGPAAPALSARATACAARCPLRSSGR